MADDDGGDWFTDAADEAPAAEKPAAGAGPQAAAAAAGGDDGAPGAAEGEGAPGEAAEEPAGEDEYLDPDKLLLFKHWIRPRFLQYRYLYDYRRNYYDDVIDYLDKRNRGVTRDIPHPQTWAERALRTYNSKLNKLESFRKEVEDLKLVTQTRLSGSFQLHHSKSYISRRYSSVLA